MSHVEVETQTVAGRLAKSIVSVGGGLMMLFISLLVLFFNEGRAVKTEKSLNEGASNVTTVPSDKVNSAFDGHLVHVNGEAKTADVLTDPVFKVSVNAVKLERSVEMYQWREKKETKERKLAGGTVKKITTYDYERTWSKTPIRSSDFSERGHHNPAMPYAAEHWSAEKVSLGAFTLSAAQIEKIRDSEELAVTAAQAKTLEKALDARLDKTSLYLGEDPINPEIGDVRVRFAVVKPGPLSVVAVQTGSTFKPWPAPSGDDVLLLERGTRTGAQMFAQAQSNNTAMTFILRMLGWGLLFAGLRLVFKPLVVVADVVPVLGTALNAGLGVFAFVLASSVSLIIIGLSWLFFRPVSAVVLLAVGGGVAFALFKYAKGRRGKKAAALPIAHQYVDIERQGSTGA